MKGEIGVDVVVATQQGDDILDPVSGGRGEQWSRKARNRLTGAVPVNRCRVGELAMHDGVAKSLFKGTGQLMDHRSA